MHLQPNASLPNLVSETTPAYNNMFSPPFPSSRNWSGGPAGRPLTGLWHFHGPHRGGGVDVSGADAGGPAESFLGSHSDGLGGGQGTWWRDFLASAFAVLGVLGVGFWKIIKLGMELHCSTIVGLLRCINCSASKSMKSLDLWRDTQLEPCEGLMDFKMPLQLWKSSPQSFKSSFRKDLLVWCLGEMEEMIRMIRDALRIRNN